MHALVKIAMGALAVSLAASLASPANASARTSALTSSSCVKALDNLAAVQSHALAPTPLLEAASQACYPSSQSFPRAVFATLSVGENSVGVVFAQTSPTRLEAHNLAAATYLLMNAHTVGRYQGTDLFAMTSVPATVSLAGQEVDGFASTAFGDGGQLIEFEADEPLARASARAQRAASRPFHEGQDLLAFTDEGVRHVKVGPKFAGTFASLAPAVTGTLTRPGGSLAGSAGLFGTGMDEKSSLFWHSRSLFEPYRP